MTVTHSLLFSVNCINTFISIFPLLANHFLPHDLHEAIVLPAGTFNFFLCTELLQTGYILMFPFKTVGQHRTLDSVFSTTTSKGSLSVLPVKY